MSCWLYISAPQAWSEKIERKWGKERKAPTEANTPSAWGGKRKMLDGTGEESELPKPTVMEDKGRGKSKKSPQLRSKGAYEGSWWDARKSRTQVGLCDLFIKLPLSHGWAVEGAKVNPELGTALGAVLLEQVAFKHTICPTPHCLASV